MKENETFWILVASSFLVYFILAYLLKQLSIINLEGAIKRIKGIQILNARHLAGIFLFGLLFYWAFPETRVFLNWIEYNNSIFLILLGVLILGSALLANNAYRSRTYDFKNNIRANPYQAWGYFVLRLSFLFSYEFFFRGILFLGLLPSVNLIYALLINTTLYVIIHLFDAKKEVLGAIPFGIVMCLCVYYTDSIWPAFLMHATLSLTYEVSLFKNIVFNIKRS